MLSRPTSRSLGLGLCGRGACVARARCQRYFFDLVKSDVFFHWFDLGDCETFVGCVLPLRVVVDDDVSGPTIICDISINQAPRFGDRGRFGAGHGLCGGYGAHVGWARVIVGNGTGRNIYASTDR